MPDYERLYWLGGGNFGEVWLVYDHALGVRWAVKYVSPSRIHNPTEFYSEPQTLMRLNHDKIVRVHDAGREPDGTLYIAMEYLSKGSLKDKYMGGPLPIRTAHKYLCDICWGVEYAHQRGFIHRDIKPSNILLDRDWKAKLSDFGLATHIPRGPGASPHGYRTHLAPEVFADGITTKLTDIYALGVTAYRLFNGDAFLPILGADDDIEDLIRIGQYPDRKHYRPYIPRAVRRIVNKAMHVDPTERYQSASTFRRALEGVNLHCNWSWRQASRKTVIYRATIGSNVIKVVIKAIQDEKFNIITTKRSGNNPERRRNHDCAEGLLLNQMKSTLHNILSRYVTQGR